MLSGSLGGTGDQISSQAIKSQMQIRPAAIQTSVQSSSQSANLLQAAAVNQSQAFIQSGTGLHNAISQAQGVAQSSGVIQAQQMTLNPVGHSLLIEFFVSCFASIIEFVCLIFCLLQLERRGEWCWV